LNEVISDSNASFQPNKSNPTREKKREKKEKKEIHMKKKRKGVPCTIKHRGMKKEKKGLKREKRKGRKFFRVRSFFLPGFSSEINCHNGGQGRKGGKGGYNRLGRESGGRGRPRRAANPAGLFNIRAPIPRTEGKRKGGREKKKFKEGGGEEGKGPGTVLAPFFSIRQKGCGGERKNKQWMEKKKRVAAKDTLPFVNPAPKKGKGRRSPRGGKKKWKKNQSAPLREKKKKWRTGGGASPIKAPSPSLRRSGKDKKGGGGEGGGVNFSEKGGGGEKGEVPQQTPHVSRPEGKEK